MWYDHRKSCHDMMGAVILELYTKRTRNYGDMHGNRGINGWSWRMGGLSIICDRRGEENNTAEGERRAAQRFHSSI